MILFLLKDKGREGRIAAQKELSDAMHVSPATVAVSLKSLEREGYEVTYLRPDRQGNIAPEQVEEAIRRVKEALRILDDMEHAYR